MIKIEDRLHAEFLDLFTLKGVGSPEILDGRTRTADLWDWIMKNFADRGVLLATGELCDVIITSDGHKMLIARK